MAEPTEFSCNEKGQANGETSIAKIVYGYSKVNLYFLAKTVGIRHARSSDKSIEAAFECTLLSQLIAAVCANSTSAMLSLAHAQRAPEDKPRRARREMKSGENLPA